MADKKAQKKVSTAGKNPNKTAKNCEYMTYSAREAFKRLRTNAMISLGEKAEKNTMVIGVTSAQPSEGKSTISINLAYTLAETGKNVALMDCDLRCPSIHAKMGMQQAPGITDVLYGNENLSNIPVRYNSSADHTHFDVIPAGALPDNPSEILGSRNFIQLLEVVQNAYDVVILDLPPVNAVIDAAVVSNLTDGLLVVIRENHCPRFVLADCMEQLQYTKANILGFVLNGSVNGAGKRYQYGKAYRYDYGYYQSSQNGK